MSFWTEGFWDTSGDSVPNGVYVELNTMEVTVEVPEQVEIEILDSPIIAVVVFETLEVES